MVDDFINIDSPSSFLFKLLERFGEDATLKRIFQIILLHNCQTILIESFYKHEAWDSEYEKFYKNLFKAPSNSTTRLHFFAAQLIEQDFANLEQYQEQYLGFCVLRPLENQKVISASIKPFEDANEPKRSFLLCNEIYDVDIETSKGIWQKLHIASTPFTQQDGQLGRCSHAAIQTVDSVLIKGRNRPQREKKPNTPYFTGDIVGLLSEFLGIQRQIPSEGLIPIQISQALIRMGYDPLVYEYEKDKPIKYPPEKIVYHYLESNIPIILGVPTSYGNHALTVIGHSFEPDLWWATAGEQYYGQDSGLDYKCSTNWVQNFILHDDNFGPYLTLPKEMLWFYAHRNLIIIVPLPPGVNMKGEEAETIAHAWAVTVADKRKEEESDSNREYFEWFNILYDHLHRQDIVLRTWLLESGLFKEKFVDPEVADYYEFLNMPDNVWLTEVSIPELFCQQRLRLGEVIIDPTEAKFRTALLAVHLPGFMITRNMDTDEWNEFVVPDDKPFGHIIR